MFETELSRRFWEDVMMALQQEVDVLVQYLVFGFPFSLFEMDKMTQ